MANPTASSLTAETLVRYSRQIRLPGIGTQGQERLLKARVLLIGMGALGGPAAMYLTAAGVGTLGIADFDSVEAHNLQRQIIHREDSIGTPKLDSAINTLKAINPAVNIERHDDGITTENAVALITAYDLVIDGSDNFPTRYLVNDAAFLARRPLVYGSIFQFEGQLSVFDPTNANSPCYRCLFPQMPEPGTVPNCEEAGVFGALPGVIGSFQALEAIKLITGVGKPLVGRLMVVDGLNHRTRYITLKKDQACPLCSKQPSISTISPENYQWACASEATPEASAEQPAATAPNDMSCDHNCSCNTPQALPLEISVEQAHEILSSPPEGITVTVIDVREDYEHAIGHIPDSRLMPLGTIAKHAEHLPKDDLLLVYCHHGMRSLRAVNFLRQCGLDNAISIRGGIDAWAVKVDSSIPRY